MAFQPSFNKETGVIKVLVRLSYCRVFEKSASVEGGKLAYRTNGLMSKTTEEGKASIRIVNQAIRAMVDKEWPGKNDEARAKFVKALGDRVPLFDGDEYTNADGDVREHYEGTKFVKLNNDKKIKFKNRRGEDLDIDEAKELFISGYWAVAYFHLYSMKDKGKGGNGIFSTVDALQFYKRDEEFSGGGIDDDEIDDLGEDDEDGDDLNEKPKNSGAGKKGAASIDDDDLGV